MYDIRNMEIWKKKPENSRKSEGIMDMEVTELNLSVRSYNCLKRAGCNTVGDILRLIREDENGLRKIRNLGSRSEQEILTCVERFQDEYEANCRSNAEPLPVGTRVVIRPARNYWNMNIQSLHLSEHTLRRLMEKGINHVRDLYTTDPENEPGWYAVRELFERIS